MHGPLCFLLSFFMGLPLLAALPGPCAADIALPQGLIRPYAGKPAIDLSCQRQKNRLKISLHSTGPVDYTVSLRASDGTFLIPPETGELNRFGEQTDSLFIDLPQEGKDEQQQYLFSIKGSFRTYQKVPLESTDDEGLLAKLGQNMRQRSPLTDPYDFRYERTEKEGKHFEKSLHIVFTSVDGKTSLTCDKKAVP